MKLVFVSLALALLVVAALLVLGGLPFVQALLGGVVGVAVLQVAVYAFVRRRRRVTVCLHCPVCSRTTTPWHAGVCRTGIDLCPECADYFHQQENRRVN